MRKEMGRRRVTSGGVLLAMTATLVAGVGGVAQAQEPPKIPAAPVAGLLDSGSAASGSADAANGFLGGLIPPIVLQGLAFAVVPPDQIGSFNQIISHESSWNMFAINPSGAYGLAQALPADKMAAEGPDWMFNPLTQIRWAYRYMNETYGSPNEAWAFWQAHNWY